MTSVHVDPAPGRIERLNRQVDYWVTVYKRTWRGSVISSFLMPFLYVVAMGVLLGGLVDSGGASLDGAPSYLAYIAPGLVAAHAMQTAAGETMYPVLGAVKWNKTYLGMVATPLTPADIVTAHLGFVVFRVATACGAFLLVLGVFGLFTSVLGTVLAFFVQILIGLAFGTPLYAYSAGLKDPTPFAVIFRVLIMPLFLFSGAFFPVSNLPDAIEWLAWLSPLWHGVDLTRMLTLGTVDGPLALLHVVVLGTLAGVGYWWSIRRLTRRLMH
ncbi:ABC transporter permease [Nocardioides iriomotensis]|uniref:Transport permease protein n=1 Tax=Nocardioides iriomotensis TaxID=715784 RepID=A0A4Q5J4L0_9ACTN|nr:ABC transporter permease [Nocardioides iriomotensis]RYU12461.1 ABC transporter [Nocardioides iriomotensis]